MTNEAKTWTVIIGLFHNFKVAQRAMEHAMLSVTLYDTICNEIIRQRA